MQRNITVLNTIDNVNLSEYNTWKVGGHASQVFWPNSEDSLIHYLQSIPKEMPITWLGLGSNVLILDGGIDGAVIIAHPGLSKVEFFNNVLEEYTVRAQAGIPGAKLAKLCLSRGLFGLEFLAGIPGTVGGAIKMNAGAFGFETWERVLKIELIDRSGVISIMHREEFTPSYRTVNLPEDKFVIAAHFSLTKEAGSVQIRELLQKRNASQPIGSFSCGSVFKNPKPHYAAKLIEECGLKGYKIGGAVVSIKHANFILNEGSASANDIVQLIDFVRTTVLKKTGVFLELEVKILGKELDK